MSAEEQARLEADLRVLGSVVMTGPPPDQVADAVLHRLRDEPAPTQASFSLRAYADQLVRRWQAVAAVVLAAVLILLVATPVGATVARWFGFGGVEVIQVPVAPATSLPVVPPAGADLSLDQAASLAGFTPFVPPALGVPDKIEVSADRRVLSMSWDGSDGVVRLDQFKGDVSPIFAKKYYQDVEFVTVDGTEALWLAKPHTLIYLDVEGREQAATARLAAQTLVWQRDEITLRLEGSFTKTRAITIAESN